MLKILAAIGFLAVEVLDVRNAYHLSALALSAHFTSLKQLLSQFNYSWHFFCLDHLWCDCQRWGVEH